MEASKVRKQRLKQWIDEEFEGRVASFCRYYALPESNASYLSQLLSGHRSFGERAARKLEKACRRPAGWLDVSPVAAEEVPPIRFDKHMIAKLSVEERTLIEDFISLIVKRNEQSSPSKSRVSGAVTSAPSERIARSAKKPIRESAYNKDERSKTHRKRHQHS